MIKIKNEMGNTYRFLKVFAWGKKDKGQLWVFLLIKNNIENGEYIW